MPIDATDVPAVADYSDSTSARRSQAISPADRAQCSTRLGLPIIARGASGRAGPAGADPRDLRCAPTVDRHASEPEERGQSGRTAWRDVRWLES